LVDLQEVVARAQRADLGQPAFQGARADGAGVGAGQPPAIFGVLQILARRVAPPQRPLRAGLKHAAQFALVQVHRSRGAYAARDARIDGRKQVAQVGANLLRLNDRRQQPHAAVDVVAHAPGRNHPVVQRSGRYPADGETVALVHVGHGQRPPDDPGQRGHIHQLFQRAILLGLREEILVRVQARRNVHILPIQSRHFVYIRGNAHERTGDHRSTSLGLAGEGAFRRRTSPSHGIRPETR